MADQRTPRELESRAKAERPKTWMPADLLPEPPKDPNYAYRWIRVSTLGSADPRNISSKIREGWEPIKVADYPEYAHQCDDKPRLPGSVEVGGLLLCRTPKELVDQRNAFYLGQATGQMESVDNTFMRENDPRMPLFKQRRSEVSFGRGQ
jgi:hypothetical protein